MRGPPWQWRIDLTRWVVRLSRMKLQIHRWSRPSTPVPHNLNHTFRHETGVQSDFEMWGPQSIFKMCLTITVIKYVHNFWCTFVVIVMLRASLSKNLKKIAVAVLNFFHFSNFILIFILCQWRFLTFDKYAIEVHIDENCPKRYQYSIKLSW